MIKHLRRPICLSKASTKDRPGGRGGAVAIRTYCAHHSADPLKRMLSAASGKKLTLTLVDGARAAEFTAIPSPAAAASGSKRLLPILVIAVIGGLVLNAMPCVLPVLSLKLLSVASHAGAERQRVRLGLLMTALGVIASFGLIATALIAMKASGAAIGWGIQFQWPWFIAAMAALTTLFAASLWGWLPILLPRFAYLGGGRNPPRKTLCRCVSDRRLRHLACDPVFGTVRRHRGWLCAGATAGRDCDGVCTLGVGMAAPYLAVSAFPRLVRLLPRPGRWMNGLRLFLGLALAGQPCGCCGSCRHSPGRR